MPGRHAPSWLLPSRDNCVRGLLPGCRKFKIPVPPDASGIHKGGSRVFIMRYFNVREPAARVMVGLCHGTISPEQVPGFSDWLYAQDPDPPLHHPFKLLAALSILGYGAPTSYHFPLFDVIAPPEPWEPLDLVSGWGPIRYAYLRRPHPSLPTVAWHPRLDSLVFDTVYRLTQNT